MHRSKAVPGFTLIELSIVMVILGLLIGGIMAGKSLIRASGLRSVIKERDVFATATGTFQERYNALPGDMPNAYSYWHTLGIAGCMTDTTVAGGCNGNGNGYVDHAGNEGSRFWMHLSFAGLIPGSYSGLPVDVNGFGVVTPASKLAPNTWAATSNSTTSQASDYFGVSNVELGLWLILGTPYPDVFMSGSKVTNGEAWSIDRKIDDGRATTGTMLSGYGDNGTDYYNVGTLGANAVDGLLFFKIE